MEGGETIHGEVDDGYGAVADAFEANFEQRGELGAAFCLYVDGVKRVDVWAGIADERTGAWWMGNLNSWPGDEKNRTVSAGEVINVPASFDRDVPGSVPTTTSAPTTTSP